MVWTGVALASIVVLIWLLWIVWPRFVANRIDHPGRLLIASAYMKGEPKRPDESNTDFNRRLHWYILTQVGLPPIFVIRAWQRCREPRLFPPSDVVEEYLRTRAGVPLPNGRLDARVLNGQGHMLLTLLRADEAKSLGLPATTDNEGA